MIPKIIHYCWFGKGKKSELIESCIKSWKKYCPDYEIIEWNEENFDYKSNKFAREAYEHKKWAFVADFARLEILYKYGGIYVDTDMEFLKPINNLLKDSAFIGFENDTTIAAGIIGAEKESKWIKELLEQYKEKSFIKKDGSLDTEANVEKISQITHENYDAVLDGSFQELKEGLKIYPKDFFYPKDFSTGLIDITENTIMLHHYDASWYSKIEKKIYTKKLRYIEKYGVEKGKEKYEAWYKRAKIEIYLRKYGIGGTIKKIIKKIVLCGARIIYGNNIILMESQNGFDGNSGAIYNYMINNEKYKKYKFVWFVREKKKCHETKNKRTWIFEFKEKSIKKEILHNIGSIILYDDIPIGRKNDKQKIIYLTHGMPTVKNVKGIINVPKYVDKVLCSSEEMLETMSYQFSIDKEKMFVCGTPRNDYLFKNDENINLFFDSSKYSKIILWMPTFRKSATEERNDSKKEFKLGIPLIESEKDLKKINEYLSNLNILLIIKTHPVQDTSIIKLKSMSNIIFATQDMIQKYNINLYSLIGMTDALLTDYSSVSFDYLLIDRPIGFIIDDINEYKLGFAFENIYEMMPGEKIGKLEDLYMFIDDLSNKKDDYKKERKKILKITNKYKDDKNTERVVNYLNL